MVGGFTMAEEEKLKKRNVICLVNSKEQGKYQNFQDDNIMNTHDFFMDLKI